MNCTLIKKIHYILKLLFWGGGGGGGGENRKIY